MHSSFAKILILEEVYSVTVTSSAAGRLYDLNTPYGNKEELMSLLKALREAGIKSVGDVVCPSLVNRCKHQPRALEGSRLSQDRDLQALLFM